MMTKVAKAMGVDGRLTRDVIVARQRAGKMMEEILSTPVRKMSPRKPDHKGFETKEDREAFQDCTSEQLKTLGVK